MDVKKQHQNRQKNDRKRTKNERKKHKSRSFLSVLGQFSNFKSLNFKRKSVFPYNNI